MNRRGFSLIELMVVVVMIGIMTLIGFPRIQSQLAKSEIRSATARLAAVYAQGRANAIETGRATQFNLLGNRVWLTVDVGGTLDTIGTVQHLDSIYKVALTYNAYADDLIQIDGRGILSPALAGEAVITVSRSGYSDEVHIGRYGSVQKK